MFFSKQITRNSSKIGCFRGLIRKEHYYLTRPLLEAAPSTRSSTEYLEIPSINPLLISMSSNKISLHCICGEFKRKKKKKTLKRKPIKKKNKIKDLYDNFIVERWK